MPHFQKDARFFTKDWTITLPSHPDPNLKFIRLTPTDTAAFIRFASAAAASPPTPVPKSTETPPAALIPGARMQTQYAESHTLHHALDVYISLSGTFVGWGGVYAITAPNEKPSVANIGIKLLPEIRGKGLGKTLMRVLLRLSNELEVDVIEAGTMRWNSGMRGVARSVGLVETDEVKEVRGQGVVAEVMFKDIERERWRGLDMVVEFQDQGVSE
ncbi:hypothetical protein LOCC1_G005044 [Lachnellula occidentalis]|uniref:N-acetyltransferase domain-containing protein n=1 Tax=Lachnellula occidentalis TaxID=215460 RepID=A0A8H8S153_9HELO|nr:hypothetical protein LOCC1_G005044 [Lachnellula occidentalis]